MDIQYARLDDFDAWIELAREYEHLFGPMADILSFRNAIKEAILCEAAFCIGSQSDKKNSELKGGIVISKETNEIAWLAVSEKYRGEGLGRKLLEFAIGRLDPQKHILIETFDESVPEGLAARKLYSSSGFVDYKKGTNNPAGIPTVIMQL